MALQSRIIAVALAMALSVAATQALAQATVTEQEDGAMALSIDGRQYLVPARIAEEVILAVSEYADDPQELQQAIRAIVAEHAGNPGDAELATAIAALAIYRSRLSSASTDAIMRGATFANPSVSAPSLLAAVPALGASPRAQQAGERQLAQLQATAENPAQVSPVQ